MNSPHPLIVYTIGHSTHSIEVFIQMLFSFNIKKLVDIRRFPGSRKFPQYNQENLKEALAVVGIEYLFMGDLGGRRKVVDKTKDSRWHNASFQAYAQYMETEPFKIAAKELMEIATHSATVYMCSEAVWWRCHRALVSDFLKVKGWTVYHIMGIGKEKEHVYTSPARIFKGKLSYSD